MYNYLVRFFKFLLPIIGKTSLQIAADSLAEAAYPGTTRVRGYSRATGRYPRYTERRPPASRNQAIRNVGRAVREADEMSLRKIHVEYGGYHDVLMVAFDISGTSKDDVHNWLAGCLPDAGDYEGSGIALDAWWIADDDAEGDLDSAVFVSKGNQAMARDVLRQYKLVD